MFHYLNPMRVSFRKKNMLPKSLINAWKFKIESSHTPLKVIGLLFSTLADTQYLCGFKKCDP